MNIDTPYYEDLTRLSNSNIGWFLNKGPAFLHKMLTDPPPEEKNAVLERGTMIHEFILQPEEFRKDYVIWDKSRPSSIQQEKFCQALASSLEIEPNRAVLSAFKEAYSTAGRSEDKMLSEGLKIASTLKDYIDFLRANDGRKMVTPYEYQMLKKIKLNIENHKLARLLLSPVGDSLDLNGNVTTSLYHEFHINWEWEYIPPAKISTGNMYVPEDKVKVSCKSLLDGLILDFKNKKAIIYDLKTTQKLWHFEDSINQYDYLRQLNYYKKAVQWYLENEYSVDLINNPWTFVFYIIGIDTTGSNEIRVFMIDERMVDSRNPTIFYALCEIAWHQSTGKWDHSREYYEGDGSESLNL